MAKKQKPPLSELENKVMSVLWEHGRATAELVRTKWKTGQPVKDSTVRTILRRLEEKGYVTHETEGRDVCVHADGRLAERGRRCGERHH